MPINAAQYVRMSSDQQPMSTDIQRGAISDHAGRNHYQIVRTYSDESKSGLSLRGRSGMTDLLRDVMEASCPFEVVLVLDVSRWGRYQDVDEAAYHEYHCRKHGVRIEYVAELFGQTATPNPYDSLFKHLKRVAAADYSRELAVKVRAGHAHAISLGFAAGSLPCVGYRRQALSAEGTPKAILQAGERKSRSSDRTRWVLGPEKEQHLIRRIFESYAGGVAIRRLCSDLVAEGVTCHNGTAITEVKIRRLLDNEIVVGVFNWGTRLKSYNKGTNLPALATPLRNESMVPALISRDLWKTVQARCRREASFQREGYTGSDLIERLRLALEKNPKLRYYDFADAGLPQPLTYAKHFGSLAAAYTQAGRFQSAVQIEYRQKLAKAQQLRKCFAADLTKLLRTFGIPAHLQRSKNSIVIGSIEIKVTAARPWPSLQGARWYVAHARNKRASNRWLLVMRLNDDWTGRDFFLLPPEIHASFSGTLNDQIVRVLARYRIATCAGLVDKIGASIERGSTPMRR